MNQQFVSELGEENDLVDDKDEKFDDDDADDADADDADDDADDNNDDDSATDNLGAAFYQDQRKSDWFSGYHRYEKVEDIDERLKTGKALCGFLLENDPGVVRVAFGRSRSKVDFVRIKVCTAMREELCGLNYFRFERQSVPDESESNDTTTKL